MSIKKNIFWDKKILQWEKDKYSPPANSLKRFIDVNRSLRKRMEYAKRLLLPYLKNAVILEAGCGSGMLIPFFLNNGIKQYIGIDISAKAIDAAKNRVVNIHNKDSVILIQKDINLINSQNVDICFSLGFLDWLEEKEISTFIAKIHSEYYLHSFSEYCF